MTYIPPRHVASAGTTPAGLRELLHVQGFLPRSEADGLFRHCIADLDWRQERVRLFGREVDAPRLCACYGQSGLAYRYSGVTRRCAPWTAPLREAVERIGRRLGASFNFVLANRYRDGSDAVGWHADDERGIAPVIASVSLGSERVFGVRPREGGPSTALRLGHGDLVLMWGRCQRDFRHAVPRTRAPVGARVNLTLRRVGPLGRRTRAGAA